MFSKDKVGTVGMVVLTYALRFDHVWPFDFKGYVHLILNPPITIYKTN